MKRDSSVAFTLIELLVVISIIAVLAGIALPVYTTVQERGSQTKDLSNAKQVALACKLYAADNDGKYPDKDGQAADPPTTALTSASTSNAAFACLVPNYLPTEKLFYLAKSAWSPTVPDEKTTASGDRVEASTNNFAYVLGMTETSNPNFPLIADAPATGGTSAVYKTDPTVKGGVWKGKKAIVVRCDQSGAIETCKVNSAAGTSTVEGPTGGSAHTDIFAANGTTWISATGNAVLLPNTP
ncbi:MAG: type pilus assembly protein PilA [Verrucomicrobiota bacterium]|jgi:prepilin-type N-terminal cleavage/methylation domain-containing protein